MTEPAGRTVGTQRSTRSALWALSVTVFAVGADFNIAAGIVPLIADDLAESAAAVALIASAYALPTAILAPVFGPLSDRRGRRLAIQLGLSLFIGSAVASAASPDLGILLATRAVNGLGSAIILPAVFASAGDIPDQEARARTTGLLASAFPFAALVGIPVGAVVAAVTGWRGVFLAIAALGLVAMLLVRRVSLASRLPTERVMSYVGSYRAVLGDRGALALLALTLLSRTAPGVMYVFLAEFIHVTYGVPAAQAGLVLLVFGVVGVVAARLSGRFVARVGARMTLLASIMLFASAALVLPLTPPVLPLTVAILGVWAAGSWFGLPAMLTIVASHSEAFRGTMLAFNSSAISLAGFLGPAIGAVAVASAGYAAGSWTAAALGVAAFALAWIVLPKPAVAAAPEADSDRA